jgi:predicted metal-dependent enzyme (double-stranded beta helix superfamily)
MSDEMTVSPMSTLFASPRHHTSAPLAALLIDLEAAADASLPARPAAVATALSRHLGRPGLLTPALRRSSARQYRTNIVHVDPMGRFSLVALVWRPGQRTPIHSHASWCVVGVHEGCEQERSFVLAEGQAVEAGRRTMVTGDVAALDAGDDDIHEVRNAARGITISLHVYGLDYRATGSSILRTFTQAPMTTTIAA